MIVLKTLLFFIFNVNLLLVLNLKYIYIFKFRLFIKFIKLVRQFS